MKKYITLICIVMAVLLTSCSKQIDQKNYTDYNTEVKDDKLIYKEEIKEPKINKDETIANSKEQGISEDSAQQTTKKEEDVAAKAVDSKEYTKKYGWGLKRNSTHTTPGISQTTINLLKKYNALYVGDTSRKVIYLTFDEGYENGFTPKILDVLKENNVKAAFFITGQYVKKEPGLVQRMIDEGHIIGNHTINHPSLPEISPEKLESEVIGLDRMVNEKWRVNMKYMRPPMGEYSESVLEQLNKLGHRAVFWSFAYDDYDTKNQKGLDYAYKMIMDNLHNGAIYLLHAVSSDNTNVLDKIIKDIKAQGYEFESLDSIK